MEADADLAGGYAKIGVASGKILDSVIPTTIARTSDITTAISNVVNAAPASFDTLKEIADYIATDGANAATLTSLVDTKLSSTTAASTYAPIISPTFTGTVGGITKSMVGLANVDNTSDSSKPISTATQTALDAKLSTTTATSTYATVSNLNLKAPLASPVFTGTVDFSGATVTGITALPPQINNSGKYLTTDGTSASWATLNLTSYATKASPVFTGTVDFSGATVIGVTATVADNSITSSKILDGTIVNADISATAEIATSKIAGLDTALTAKLASTTAASTYATKASPTFTGTVDLSAATLSLPGEFITSAHIANGTLMDSDISASAVISKTKIAGTAVTLADTATITNTMLANNYIGINGQLVSLGGITTIPVGAKTFYNNTGTLPTTGMVAGDIYIQY